MIDVIRGILDALEADIGDELAWQALADVGEDQNGAYLEGARSTLVLNKAQALRQAFIWTAPTSDGCQRCQSVEFHAGYAEPGYNDPASGVVALGNWNRITSPGTNEVLDSSPEQLSNLLDQLAISLEWCDEWTVCHACGKVIRTEPDSHDWHPAYNYDCDGVICFACQDEEIEDE